MSSSIKSRFNFISYKIDEFKFNMKKDVDLLGRRNGIKNSDWNVEIGVQPTKGLEDKNLYLSFIGCKLTLKIDDIELANLEASITGLFKIDKNIDLESEVINSITKYQFPTLLMPYLRSCVTSFLASAGFGSFIFPLINITELTKASEEV